MEYQLPHQQFPVIFLTQVLDFKLTMLSHQDTIVIVNFLGDLSHGF